MNPITPNLSVLVTGATDGIGRATAEALADRGVDLVIHGRNPQKLADTFDAVSKRAARVRSLVADLASLGETRKLADHVSQGLGGVDVLINNAGVGFGANPKQREVSRDGYELRFAVNYLAPYVLTRTLLERGALRRAVINVSSIGQEAIDFEDLMCERDYDGVRAYRRSKLALVMLTLDLAEKYPERQLLALHPGTFLDTSMVRASGIAAQGPVSRGVESVLSVLEAALVQKKSGLFYNEREPARANAQAYIVNARKRLRELSDELVR